MTTCIYGIKNCNSMKKVFDWFEAHGIKYEFHDYKKHGIDEKTFGQAIKEHGWETVINRKGMTWRTLPDDIKINMNETGAKKVALENASIVKRPLILHHGKTYLGFDEALYAENFTAS